MAKRLTDTNKYRNQFFRSLPMAYKLLWDYLYHECDHAGIWIVDFDAVRLCLGKDVKIDRKKALELFNKEEQKVVEIAGGKKWFMSPFIEFQYGFAPLNEKNSVHKSVIGILKKYDLLTDDNKIKPPDSPLQGAKDKDIDKDKDKSKDKDKDAREEILENTVDVEIHPLIAAVIKDFPRVQQMKEPLTIEQAKELCNKHGPDLVLQIVGEMHNWEPLLKKNTSAYLTINNWLNRRKNDTTKNFNGNGRGQTNSSAVIQDPATKGGYGTLAK